LAAVAYRISPGPVTRTALFAVFTHRPAFLGFLRIPSTGFIGGRPLADGQLLLAERQGGTPVVIDPARNGTMVARFSSVVNPAASADDFDVSADGTTVAVATTYRSSDQAPPQFQLGIYDLATRALRFPPIFIAFHAGAVALNAGGTRVAVAGGHDGAAAEFDARTGMALGSIPPLPRPAAFPPLGRNTAAVRYSPDGHLYVGSIAGPVRVFDQVEREVARWDAGTGISTGSMWLTADARVLITTGFPGGMVAFDTATGTTRWRVPTYVECSDVSRTGSNDRLYCLDGSGAPRVYDVATGALVNDDLNPQVGQPSGMIVSGDGRTVYRVGFRDGTIGHFSRDGEGLVTRSIPGWAAGPFNADGRRLLLSDTRSDARVVWDPTTNTVIDDLQGLKSARWTDDPTRLAAIFPDATIGEYDLSHRQRVPGVTVPVPANLVDFVVDDRHDRLALARGDGSVEIVDRSGRTVARLGTKGPVYEMAFTADGKTVAVAQEAGTTFFDVASGTTRETLAGVQAVALAGKTLVGVNADGAAQFYDPATLAPVASPVAGSFDPAAPFNLSNDGRTLLASGADVRLHLIDVASKSELGDGIAETSGAGPAGFLAPDGRRLVVDAAPFGVAVWNLDPEEWRHAACRLAGRDLTTEEWSRYVSAIGSYHPACGPFR
ncbi:MAG: PQQ-binding-like beta-propeller repeat protein, partial [Actinomycetota bacterium]|nr:PQQ-binding-like beta-propeller repeat protein [Actinomycetota bacterium]